MKLPLAMIYGISTHIKGGPHCAESCGKGLIPTVIHISDGGAEVHLIEDRDRLERIVDADGVEMLIMGCSHLDFPYIHPDFRQLIAETFGTKALVAQPAPGRG